MVVNDVTLGQDGGGEQSQRLSRTIDGVEFASGGNQWVIPTAQGRVTINFDNMPGVAYTFREQIKDACTALLLANAPERIQRNLTRFRGLLRHILSNRPDSPIKEITAADVENYGASLPKHQSYFLRHVRDFLVAWAKTGVGGLSHDLLLLLPELETKGHEIGAAVRTMDPNKGPLTDIEYESVVAAIRQAFACGNLSLADYALAVLAIVLGARPLQLAMLKAKDLSVTDRSDGSKIYILQVTRMKQGKNIRPRTLFRPRELAAPVGILIEQQAAAARVWAATYGLDPAEAPLFPCSEWAPRSSRAEAAGLEGHLGSSAVTTKMARMLKQTQVRSSRTGEPMRLFQTRLRRTLGTRAAAEGLSAEIIADLMDHSWVDSSLVYIEARPAMIERIDKALALKMAPLAQAFAGTLVGREEGRNASKVSKGRVIHIETEDALEDIGGCGKFDFCGLAAPLACYTCSYFRPWLDDIHEVLLDRLVGERNSLLGETDLRMASVNDRTILAVADVVNQCRAAKEGAAA